MAVATRRRQRQQARLHYPAGSDGALLVVRGFISQQQRIRQRSDEVDAMLRKLERVQRRRFAG